MREIDAKKLHHRCLAWSGIGPWKPCHLRTILEEGKQVIYIMKESPIIFVVQWEVNEMSKIKRDFSAIWKKLYY